MIFVQPDQLSPSVILPTVYSNISRYLRTSQELPKCLSMVSNCLNHYNTTVKSTSHSHLNITFDERLDSNSKFGNLLAAYFHKQANNDMKTSVFSHWSLKTTCFTKYDRQVPVHI